jgi:hypothetical protein
MLTPTIKDRIAHHCCLIYEKNVEVYVYLQWLRTMRPMENESKRTKYVL